jgi:SnoaL-like domain
MCLTVKRFGQLQSVRGVCCTRTLVDGAVLLFLLAFAITPQLGQSNGSTPTMRDSEFFAIMRTVSDGWNEGNASKAADCFTDDAVYMEPPNRQVYVGRKAIYVFFGGPKQPESPMQMKWHHLAFNAQEQLDTGSTHSKETISTTAS